MSSGKWRPFCLGLNVFTLYGLVTQYGDIDRSQDWRITWQYQAITLANVDLLSMAFCGTHLRPFSQKVLKISTHKMSSKIHV